MAQLPNPVPSLTGEYVAMYEHMKAQRGSIDGMYEALLNHPELTRHVSNLGGYLRFGSTLPGKYREFIILYAAAQMRVPYEWVKHIDPALQAGLSEDITEKLRNGKWDFEEPYADFIVAADHVLKLEMLPQELQSRLEKKIELKGVIELVVLVGFYRMIAGVIRAFDVALPVGRVSPWAD